MIDHLRSFLERIERDPWLEGGLRVAARDTLKEMGVYGQQNRPNRDHGTVEKQAKALNPTPLDPKGDGSFKGPDGA